MVCMPVLCVYACVSVCVREHPQQHVMQPVNTVPWLQGKLQLHSIMAKLLAVGLSPDSDLPCLTDNPYVKSEANKEQQFKCFLLNYFYSFSIY